jgi:hypothetical protein
VFLVSLIALFYFSFAWVSLGWGGSISRVTRWARGKREGSYPRGGVGYLWLARPFRLVTRAPPGLTRAKVESYLARLRVEFFAKNGTIFLGGVPPTVAPEGDLVF